MKKIILMMALVLPIFLLKEEYYVIPNESIRFRIISNSNSSKDIVMKEMATSEVLSVIETMDTSKISTSREEILNNINTIESRINKLFKNNDYEKSVNVKYGLNEFPEKIYKGVKYEEGMYESLVIEIGEAKGNNYWCVLYPPLCLVDENESETVYKSKIIEIIERLF